MTDGVSPAPASNDSAVAWFWLRTSGTWVVAGPFETESVIVAPLEVDAPGGGSEVTTTPCAWSD